MECLEARQRGAEDPAAQAHVGACAVCRAVIGWPTEAVPAALLDTRWQLLQSHLRHENSTLRGRLRAWPRGRAVWISTGLAWLVIVIVLLVGRRPDADGWTTARVVELVLGSVWIAALLRMGMRPALVPATPRAWLISASVVTCVAAVASAWLPPTVSTVPQWDSAFWASAGRCLAWGCLCVIPAAAWLILTQRQLNGLPQRLAGAVGCGTIGLLALESHCGDGNFAHRLLGHSLVVMMCAMVSSARH